MAETVLNIESRIQLGLREVCCVCDKPECVMNGKIAEITTLIRGDAAIEIAKAYIEKTPGMVLAMPSYITIEQARTLASVLNQIADDAERQAAQKMVAETKGN